MSKSVIYIADITSLVMSEIREARYNGWIRLDYDSPSMPVRGLGVSFEGVPEVDKWLFLKTQRVEKLSVRR